MKTIALTGLLLLSAAAPQALDESDYRFANSVERAFSAGGTVRLNLSAGDYRVTSRDDNRIRVTWRTRTAGQLGETSVRVRVNGDAAVVEASGPDHGAYRVVVELPRRSDLHIRMTAGDLSIAGIEGNKDVRLGAGDLDIEADPTQYRHVRASVLVGDLAARPFRFSTGGLFRRFDHEGRGPFNLRVRLWAGDLKLVRRGAE